jgi:CRISPR type III-B/RAMP module-associated protein Cmr5
MKTREQLRAERAHANVTALKPEQIEEYAGELRELPSMVVQSGLGPTLAYMKARGGPARTALYDHLSGWVSETIFGEPKGDLLSLVIANPSSKLLRAHEESLALAAWLRRFAEARDPKARKP